MMVMYQDKNGLSLTNILLKLSSPDVMISNRNHLKFFKIMWRRSLGILRAVHSV